MIGATGLVALPTDSGFDIVVCSLYLVYEIKSFIFPSTFCLQISVMQFQL